MVYFSSPSPDHPLFDPPDDTYHQIDYSPWVGSGWRRLRLLAETVAVYPDVRQSLQSVDLIVGFGGYPTVPVLLAARELAIPIFLQEQNRFMGRANRLFSRAAQTIFHGLPPVKEEVSKGSRIIGNPVRHVEPTEEEWFHEKPLLVVFGGSQGARALSEHLAETGPRLIEEGWRIYHVRGDHGRSLKQSVFPDTTEYREVRTDVDLPSIIACAQCVWGRAGAGTISELIHYDIPGLLFPYPYAADDHQRENARWAASVGPVHVADDQQHEPNHLTEITLRLADEESSYQVPWDRETPASNRIVEELTQWT